MSGEIIDLGEKYLGKLLKASTGRGKWCECLNDPPSFGVLMISNRDDNNLRMILKHSFVTH